MQWKTLLWLCVTFPSSFGALACIWYPTSFWLKMIVQYTYTCIIRSQENLCDTLPQDILTHNQELILLFGRICRDETALMRISKKLRAATLHKKCAIVLYVKPKMQYTQVHNPSNIIIKEQLILLVLFKFRDARAYSSIKYLWSRRCLTIVSTKSSCNFLSFF